MNGFDPKQYWDDRLRQDFSLGGVGFLGLGEEFNRWMYRVRRDVFLRSVRPNLPHDRAVAVLDVGAGTGFYLDLWRSLGVRDVTAADISEFAVESLRARYPDVTVVQADISQPTMPAALAGRQFDVVSAMDMLFHVVDDEAYQRALQNLVGLVKPDGLLVFSELFLAVSPQRERHDVFRSQAETESGLRSAGAVPVTMHPSFVLLNEPVNSENRALHAWWSTVSRVVQGRPRLAGPVGAVAYGLETVTMRLFPNYAPSVQLAIWRNASPRARS